MGLQINQSHSLLLLTTNAIHAVVHRMRHRIVIGGQAEPTVGRLLARVVGDAGQERIHV